MQDIVEIWIIFHTVDVNDYRKNCSVIEIKFRARAGNFKDFKNESTNFIFFYLNLFLNFKFSFEIKNF